MNPRRLFAIAYKETLQVIREPRSLAVALLMPLLQMVLLGYGVSLDIRRVPLCIYDQDNSQVSRELVQGFTASGWFANTVTLHSDAAIRDAMDRGVCVGALVIPVSFARVMTTTGSAPVQTVFDATDTNTSNVAIGYAEGMAAQVTATFETRWARLHGFAPSTAGTVDLEPRVWFNEGLDSRNFIIPGVVAIILALVGAQLTSLTVSREWERGTMEQLISTPVKALEVMVGKLVPYFMIGMFDAAFCLCAAIFWFEIPLRGSVATLIVTTGLFTLVVLGIGYLMSVRIRSQLGASQPGRADPHHAADHPAVGLHLPDRPDAGGAARGHAAGLRPLLRQHPARRVPEGQFTRRHQRPGAGAGRVCGGDHLARRARLPQAAGLSACWIACASCW